MHKFMEANGQLHMSLHPSDQSLAIRWDHYENPSLEEITLKLDVSVHFSKLDGT